MASIKGKLFCCWKLLCFVSICCAYLSNNAVAQYTNFRNFSFPEGLPQPYVYSISQDTSGFLWVGTGDGFSQFDGFRFKTYHISNGLAENFVTSSFTDSKGQVWAGHYQGAISLYQAKNDSFRTLQKSEEFNSRINQIAEDADGNIWFLPQNRGLLRYDSNHKISTYPFHGGKAFFAFVPLDDSNFLVGSQEGLWQLSLEGEQLVAKEHYSALQKTPVKALAYWQEANMYLIGTKGNGLWGMHPEKPPFPLLSSPALKGNITSILTNNKHIWVGTKSQGVYLIEKQQSSADSLIIKRHFVGEHGLASPFTLNLFEDREQTLWVGTNGGGLFQYQGQRFTPIAFPFVEKNIRTISKAFDGRWLIGTSAQGLYEAGIANTLQITDFQKINSIPNEATIISSVFHEQKQVYWFGIDGKGLYYMEKDRKPKSINQQINDFPAKHIQRLIVSKDNSIWVASRLHGLFRINPTTFQFKQFNTLNGLMHNSVIDLKEDSKGRIWAVTAGGVCYLVKDEINYLEQVAGIENLTFNCVEEDGSGNIWLGSDGNGVFQYDDAVFTNYQTQHGLASAYIHSIVATKNGTWFLSRNAMSFFENDTKQIKSYSSKQLENEIETYPHTYYKDKAQKIWFGTNQGLTLYDPEQDIKNNTAPKVAITGFYIFDQRVAFEGNQKLPFRKYRMRFDFKALSLKQPEAVRYQYQLEGYETTWSTLSSDTSVRFPQIDDGYYTFRVKAMNEDGVWSKTPASFSFVVGKPIWKEWWFYIGLILVVGLSFYFYYRWKLQNLLRINNMLEQKVEERTRELGNANTKLAKQKTEIESAYNKLMDLESFKDSMTNMIVHDLKNPLNSIIALSDHNPSVKQAGQQMLNMVMNILDVNKLEEANLKLNQDKHAVQQAIEEAIAQVSLLLHEKGMTLHKKLDTSIYAVFDYEMIVRVIVNLLTNSIKYTSAGGTININSWLTAHEQTFNFHVSVKDNGPGIGKQFQRVIFNKYKQLEQKHSGIAASTGLGLTFCKLAVEAHSGTIEVDSEVGIGSEFIFQMEALPPSETHGKEQEGQIVDETLSSVPIPLSLTDKETILPYAQKIRGLDIYDTSENISLIVQIPDNSAQISTWKNEMELAVFAFNLHRYQELINLAFEKGNE